MRLFGPIAVSVLAGIFTPALAQQKGNPAMPCYEALAGDARFAVLRDKVILGPTNRADSQRIAKNTERPTREEAAAISQWRLAREECHKIETPYYATRDTEIQATVNQYFANLQGQVRELEVGKLTYGEFEKRRFELYEKVSRDVESIRKDIVPSTQKPIQQTPK